MGLLASLLGRLLPTGRSDGRLKRKRECHASLEEEMLHRGADKRHCKHLDDRLAQESVWMSNDAKQSLKKFGPDCPCVWSHLIQERDSATLMLVAGSKDQAAASTLTTTSPAPARLKAERLVVPFDVRWIVGSWLKGALEPMGPYAIQTRSKTLCQSLEAAKAEEPTSKEQIIDFDHQNGSQEDQVTLSKTNAEDSPRPLEPSQADDSIKLKALKARVTKAELRRLEMRAAQGPSYDALMKLYKKEEKNQYPWNMLYGDPGVPIKLGGEADTDTKEPRVPVKIKKESPDPDAESHQSSCATGEAAEGDDEKEQEQVETKVDATVVRKDSPIEATAATGKEGSPHVEQQDTRAKRLTRGKGLQKLDRRTVILEMRISHEKRKAQQELQKTKDLKRARH